MEKYGVQVKNVKLCPLCGKELDQDSTPPTCPMHGTAGIEREQLEGEGKEENHEEGKEAGSQGDR